MRDEGEREGYGGDGSEGDEGEREVRGGEGRVRGVEGVEGVCEGEDEGVSVEGERCGVNGGE